MRQGAQSTCMPDSEGVGIRRRVGLAVDPQPQLLADLEERDALGTHGDDRPGLRVAAVASLAVLDHEAAEAADLDALAAAERGRHAVEHGVDHCLGVAPREPGKALDDLLDEIPLGHRAPWLPRERARVQEEEPARKPRGRRRCCVGEVGEPPRPAVRPDPRDPRLAGASGALPGQALGRLEAPELVDEPGRLRLRPRVRPAVGERAHPLGRHAAPPGDRGDELREHVVDHALEEAPILVGHRTQRLPDVLERAALHDRVLEAHLGRERSRIDELHDGADRARERARIGDDRVGRGRDVIRRRGGHVAERGHDGLLPPQAPDRLVELLCRRHRATRRVDAQHDGHDGRVLAELLERLLERVAVAQHARELGDADARADEPPPCPEARRERGEHREARHDGETPEDRVAPRHARPPQPLPFSRVSRSSGSSSLRMSAKENFPPSRSRFMYASTSSRSSLRRSALLERPMRFSRESTLITSASTVSPTLKSVPGLSTRSLASWETWMRPSTPSSSSTNTPKSVRLFTLPLTRLPTGWFARTSSQGLGSVCLRPSEMRWLTLSTSSTWTSTSWPTSRIFEGCVTRFVHDISETWISPSSPRSSSTNAP